MYISHFHKTLFSQVRRYTGCLYGGLQGSNCVQRTQKFVHKSEFAKLYFDNGPPWVLIRMDSPGICWTQSLKKVRQSTCIAPCMVQTSLNLKRSGMDHTAFNLQRTPCQSLPRKRSPVNVVAESNCSPLLIYRPREDERLSWPGCLTYSGRLTHISGHPSATGRAQDGERTLVRD